MCLFLKELNEVIKKKNQGEIKKPSDLKVIVDNMLQGLGKHLRRCGVDTVIMENHHTREVCIDVNEIVLEHIYLCSV